MAVCEVYVGSTSVDTDRLDEQVRVMALEEEIRVTEDAGLLIQARRARTELFTGLRPLGEDELRVWLRWFPAMYGDKYYERTDDGSLNVIPSGTNPQKQGLKSYGFDRVPMSAQLLIARCRDEWEFDRVFICTPEKDHQDPGLFAGKNDDIYLLARWGESDEQLLTFDQIKAGLDARDRVAAKDGTAFMVCFGGGMCVAGIVCFILSEYAGWSTGAVLLGGLASWIATGVGCSRLFSAAQQRIREAFPYAF